MADFDDQFHLEFNAGCMGKPDPEYDCAGGGGPNCNCYMCQAIEKGPCKFCGGDLAVKDINGKLYFPCTLCGKFK